MEFWKKGRNRILVIGDDLFCHNEVQFPTDKQKKEMLVFKLVNFLDDEDEPGFDIETYVKCQIDPNFSMSFALDEISFDKNQHVEALKKCKKFLIESINNTFDDLIDKYL